MQEVSTGGKRHRGRSSNAVNNHAGALQHDVFFSQAELLFNKMIHVALAPCYDFAQRSCACADFSKEFTSLIGLRR
jgi:hypothetical protein